MPHVIIDYSADLDGAHDLHGLCVAIFDALSVHPAVNGPETLKIRAHPSAYWHIGTDPQSFAHADLKILPGRDEPTKASMARAVLDCMAAALPEVGSLSVDVSELDATYQKRVL